MDFVSDVNKTSHDRGTCLCIGIDPHQKKLDEIEGLDKRSMLLDFGRKIVDHTREFVCAFKINIAFFEVHGAKGIEQLIELISYIKKSGTPLILDCKRGDIGSTAEAYAKACFEVYKADAVTLSPYMGWDSVKPFADYKGNFSFILALTSNEGANDFQLSGGLYRKVAKQVIEWNKENLGLVIGATKPGYLRKIRKSLGFNGLILVPGIGVQGGDLNKVMEYGINNNGKGLIISISRSIIFASMTRKFYEAAAKKAFEYRAKMNI